MTVNDKNHCCYWVPVTGFSIFSWNELGRLQSAVNSNLAQQRTDMCLFPSYSWYEMEKKSNGVSAACGRRTTFRSYSVMQKLGQNHWIVQRIKDDLNSKRQRWRVSFTFQTGLKVEKKSSKSKLWKHWVITALLNDPRFVLLKAVHCGFWDISDQSTRLV